MTDWAVGSLTCLEALPSAPSYKGPVLDCSRIASDNIARPFTDILTGATLVTV